MTSRVRSLLDAGYRQVSRKYRTLAALPAGMSGLDALRSVDPAFARDLLARAEREAAEFYLRVYATDKIVLSEEEFNEYTRLHHKRSCP